MKPMNLAQVVRNIDRRLERVEQILPTLPTRDELREEFERSRGHTDVLFETLNDSIRIVAEGFAATQTAIDGEIRPTLADHGRRIAAVEDTHRHKGSSLLR